MKSDTLKQLLPEEELSELKSQIPKNETPLWKYWEEFVEDWIDYGKSQRTLESVRSFLRLLIRKTEFKTVEKCNQRKNLKILLKEMKKDRNLKGTTFNKYLGSLITYYRWLEEMEYITDNQVNKIRKFGQKALEVEALEKEQVLEILNYIYTASQTAFVRKRNILFFDMLRITGFRRCEVLDLTTDDISQNKRTGVWAVKVRRAKQKGGLDEIFLPQWAVISYQEYMEARNKTRPDEKALFCSQSKKEIGWGEKGVTYFLNQVEKAVGFKVTSKMFRSYAATHLAESGVPLERISLYLGHKNVKTTLKYIKRTGKLHQLCSDIMAKQPGKEDLKVKNFIPSTEL